MNRTVRFTSPLFLLVVLLLTAVQPAHAHTRVEVGPYTLILGWVSEPVIVGERNALLLDVRRGNAPVTDAAAGLDMTVHYAGRTYTANLQPGDEPGVYIAPIIPTARGEFEVEITGLLGETPVDERLIPEEVLPAGALAFPETEPDPFELEEQITALQAEVETANTRGLVGMGAGLAGIIVAAVGWLRQRAARGLPGSQ